MIRTHTTKNTIGVAMSGGVDSTVTAGLLLEQGYAVHGFFMLLPLPGIEHQQTAVEDIAVRLNIPLSLVDVREQFSQTIIHYFIDSYCRALTPNPCVVCNQMIKCGLLQKKMMAEGMDMMATGHYADTVRHNGHSLLKRGVDPIKDQSYFLCRLSGDQLDRLVLPLGGRRKSTVVELAREMGFTRFDGMESQDVCFLSNESLADFLTRHDVAAREGKMVTADGRMLGTHRGVWKYTIGQRRGLGIPDTTPWYVTALDAEKNEVIIGKNEDLFQDNVFLEDVRWHITPPEQWQGLVQLRSRHGAAKAQVLPVDSNRWQVCFSEPQRAITPGQFAVFYDNDLVIGSGIIIRPPSTSVSKRA